MHHFRKSHSADFLNCPFRSVVSKEGSSISTATKLESFPQPSDVTSNQEMLNCLSRSAPAYFLHHPLSHIPPLPQSSFTDKSASSYSGDPSSPFSMESSSSCGPFSLKNELSIPSVNEEGFGERISMGSPEGACIHDGLAFLGAPQSIQDRYELQSLIRDSIFGKVFIALDRITHTKVAIKLSNLDLLRRGLSVNSRRVLENPIQECTIMAKLSQPLPSTSSSSAFICKCEACRLSPPSSGGHPHVLPLLGQFLDANVHWMVMPLQKAEFFDIVRELPHPPRFLRFEGQLEAVTTSQKRFNPAYLAMDRKFRNYFRQMVSALAYVHQHNICHLDFSLENLLVDEEGNLKLSDFGVAREVPRGIHTNESSLLPAFRNEKPGKLRYMAPEVLMGLPFDGFKADIFGLGVTLFCMLTAHLPFEVPAHSDPCFHMLACGKLRHLLKLLKVDSIIGYSAADLLQQLLWSNPESRVTLDAIQRHAYFFYDDEENEKCHQSF